MARNLQQRTVFLRDFAQHLSHEFKTPLAALRGTVEVLNDHLDEMTPQKRRHFLDNTRSDVERQLILVGRTPCIWRAKLRRRD